METRTQAVLKAVIETYIETGEPVTSCMLYDRYEFGIKPAMIRWELNALCKDGYLYQEHVSGGRLPSNMGYRLFVGELLDDDHESIASISESSVVLKRLSDLIKEKDAASFIEQVKLDLRVFGLWYDLNESRAVSAGLDELCTGLESSSSDVLLGVVRDFENIENRVEYMRNEWLGEVGWPKVYIGDSPLTESDYISVMVEKLVNNDGSQAFFLMMGPKRMDYKRSLHVMKYLESIFKS